MEFITYIAKSAGILTLFYLVYVFVLRKDTFFTANRTFLLVGIASALLLPFVTFTAVTFVEAPIFFPTENLADHSYTKYTNSSNTGNHRHLATRVYCLSHWVCHYGNSVWNSTRIAMQLTSETSLKTSQRISFY